MPLDKWLRALVLMGSRNSPPSVSELSRELCVQGKTAAYIVSRIISAIGEVASVPRVGGKMRAATLTARGDVSGQESLDAMIKRVLRPSMDNPDLSVQRPVILNIESGRRFSTVLADPPWRFANRTGKMAPEHKRLSRYGTMETDEIAAIPVMELVREPAHLYLWVPNALLPDGLRVMAAWGFTYKANIVWHKLRKDGGSDGRGVGFYFRNVTEVLLFGIRGKNARTLAAGRRQVNYIGTRKREHSRKPDEQYPIIESCSPGPYLELFARGERKGWTGWGDQAVAEYAPNWPTYSYNSGSAR